MTLLQLAITVFFLLGSNQYTSQQDLSGRIDSLYRNYNKPGHPGAAVLVLKDGIAVHKKGYGLANLETQTKVSAKSNFRLASVTKQFTAFAILLLVDKNQLSLQDSVRDHLPELPPVTHKVKIHHLLSHQSGLRRYERNLPDNQNQQLTDADVLQILSGLSTLQFTAGSKYQYSNSGYALLANIIERVSGVSFSEFLRIEIFDPLKMHHSVAHVEGVTRVNSRAFGYSKIRGDFLRRDQNIFSAVLGDGGIYMSLDDYQKWDSSLYVDSPTRLLSKKLLRQIFIPKKLNNGNRTQYGFGWRIDKFGSQVRNHHTGSSIGFRNVVMRLPKQKITVVVLTNRNGPSPKRLAEQTLRLAIRNLD